MKNVELVSGWSLKEVGKETDRISVEEIFERKPDRTYIEERSVWERDWISIEKMPAQVQDVLYDHGFLPEEFRLGWCEKALFIGESD